MFNRRQIVEYACPACGVKNYVPHEWAGRETACDNCHSHHRIPAGLRPKLVSVGTNPGPGLPLTPDEEAMVRREMEQRRAEPSLAALIAHQCRKVLAVALVALRGYRQHF